MSTLSIIIPVYNSAQCGLKQCLESVLEQEYKDFELILVNDGSTDESLDICKSFAVRDNRIIIINQRNAGVSHARNMGLTIANGEFITFIDSDDIVSAGYLKSLMTDASLYDLTVCGVRQSFSNGHSNKFNIPCNSTTDLTADTLHSLIQSRLAFGPYNKIFRASIINQHCLRFPEDIDYGEDRIFVFNYLSHIKTYQCVSQVYYDYIINNSESLSQKKRDNLFDLEYSQWKKLYSLYRKLNALTPDAELSLYAELYWLISDATLTAFNEERTDMITSYLAVPELDAIKKYAKHIDANRLAKHYILNRKSQSLKNYYKLLKLCRK